MRVLGLVVLLASLLIIQSCGGGSSGSGSSDGVRLLHASLDDAPLYVETSAKPGESLALVRFAETTGYTALPKGAQTISVEGGQVARLSSQSFLMEGGQRRSVLFYREVSSDSPSLKIFEDLGPDIDHTQSAVRFIHAVTGAAALDVIAGAASMSVAFADSSDYVVLPAGVISIEAKRQVDSRTLISGLRDLKGGETYTFLLSGEVGYAVFISLFEG